MSNLDDFLAVLDSTRPHELRAELKTLQGIRSWAIEQLGLDYEVGDRVTIVNPRPSQTMGGWTHYREALAVGQTGIVARFGFDVHKKEWYIIVDLDRSWSLSEGPQGEKRYWNGPAHLTPEGFEPPSRYDREHYPEGKIKSFYMNPYWVTRYEPGESEPEKPSGLSRYAADLARIHSEESC